MVCISSNVRYVIAPFFQHQPGGPDRIPSGSGGDCGVRQVVPSPGHAGRNGQSQGKGQHEGTVELPGYNCLEYIHILTPA